MIKKVVVLLTALAMLFSFGACRPEHERVKGLGTYEGLDPETELQIIKWWYGDSYKGQKTVNNFSFNYYYGVYSGYVVFNKYPGWSFGLSFPDHDIVDGLFFEYYDYPSIGPRESKGPIVAWKDGQSYGLSVLYESGNLTRADLEAIYSRHREFSPDLYEHERLTGLGTYEWLHPGIELKIIKTFYYHKYFGQESVYFGQEAVDDFRFDCYYGTYNGYLIFNFSSSWLNWEAQQGYSEIVDDLEFICMTRADWIIVWRDNTHWLELLLAYEIGIGDLTRADLEEIHSRYKEYRPQYYTDSE